ncbi:hypothetical protein QBC32DRAFT_112956 [Pseudoneurospora amorphoporcata]|uniref:Uncharacterized protein n=1 Tax=Pseudoneurospora amorphoporcata TaxID=241081 RepID=A0AAN6NXF0_9PEZI|nr:hypothetical protein QBC32DRAFT_112956 [Pseudoneurospora amorphoporcata]
MSARACVMAGSVLRLLFLRLAFVRRCLGTSCFYLGLVSVRQHSISLHLLLTLTTTAVLWGAQRGGKELNNEVLHEHGCVQFTRFYGGNTSSLKALFPTFCKDYGPRYYLFHGLSKSLEKVLGIFSDGDGYYKEINSGAEHRGMEFINTSSPSISQVPRNGDKENGHVA